VSRYSAFIVFVLLLFSLGCSAKSININLKKEDSFAVKKASADFWYMAALDCEYRMQYECSALMYEKLYSITKQEEFLRSMVRTALLSNHYDLYKKHLKEIDKIAEGDNEIASYLVPYYLKEKNYKMAEKYSKEVLKSEKSLKNYQLLAALYIDTKHYKKAEKVLDEYISEFGCDPAICGMKLFIKTKQNDVNGTIKLLKRLYEVTKNQSFELELLKLYVSIGDFKSLEKYVRENKDLKKDILIDIYTSVKNYKRAEEISMELYKETKDPIYLADAAIYLYESEYKKNPAVLKKVIKRFEKSVKKLKDPMFYNYYGYLLIDHDVDVKKGIKLVKKALTMKPDNEYYLDSLAWGYYKIGKCKEALKILENLKDKDQDEIKEHIQKVKECLKR